MKIEIPSLFSKTTSEKKFWSIYNALKAEFVNYFYELLKKIDWNTTLLRNDTEIYSKILAQWKKAENFYKTRGYEVNRFKGILYEILFWYSALKNETLFKQGWRLYLMGDERMKNVVKEKPIRFEIIPLYEPKPPFYFYNKKSKKIIDRLPQIRADFLILYTEALDPREIRKNFEMEFIDVKSYPVKKQEIKWQTISAGWFGCSFGIAYPKKGKEYPSSLEDWEIKRFPPSLL